MATTPDRPSPYIDLHGSEEQVGLQLTQRRKTLGISRAEMARRAGVSYRMLQDLERGHRPRYNAITIHRIESAYQWEHDSIAQIADGGEPTPAPAAEAAPVQPRPDAEGKEYRTDYRITRTRFGVVVDRIVRDAESQLGDLSDDEAAEIMETVIDDLNAQTQIALERERRRLERERQRRDQVENGSGGDA
ncbi:helix-turn-helix transcriptional regulator [Streptomonospora sp. PA3]|uniref:helix-turn-helix domain-containing protein n=1 Tax=Streptomonospora sp. PA3 TaxID=2607326 RepID=UPI00164337B6